MQDNNRLIAHLFALGTTIVWGTTFISSKILLESLTPSEIIVYRFAIAIAFLYLLRPHFFRHGRGWRMEAAFAGAGLSGVSVYFLFENTALTYTYASNVGVIICTAPFFTGLASAIVFRDKLQGNFFWGFLVAMVGICLISFNDVSVLQLNPLGDFLALMAAASWAIYSICTRFIFKYGYPLLEVTRRIFIWGLISLIFFLPFQDEVWSMPDLANISILGNLLFLGILASGVCFATWNYALRVLGPIKTTAYIYLTPVITVAASVIFLGEHITLLAAFGIGLALAGLLLSENRFTLPDVLKEYGSRGLGLSSPDNSLIKTLKAIHLLSATAWAGGALSMQALSFLKISTADPAVREQIAYCLHFIDGCRHSRSLRLCAHGTFLFAVHGSRILPLRVDRLQMAHHALCGVLGNHVLGTLGRLSHSKAGGTRLGLPRPLHQGVHPAAEYVAGRHAARHHPCHVPYFRLQANVFQALEKN